MYYIIIIKAEKERKLKNDKYDEAVEVSQSLDQSAVPKSINNNNIANAKNVDSKDSKGLTKNNEQSKSQSILNKPFDEALEFSQSNSDSSVETDHNKSNNNSNILDSSNKPQYNLFADSKELSIEHPQRTPKVESFNEPQQRPVTLNSSVSYHHYCFYRYYIIYLFVINSYISERNLLLFFHTITIILG